ncbi:hypothetical protein SDC9_63667 [bioreactor metagenome]|uniref:Uncharacterized protein n=1 Tax=bioreactor metagenome TaxID=1076179 RepID=A0A644XMC3_9ZZZZ
MRDEADTGGGKVLFPSHFAALRHYYARPVRPLQNQPVDCRFRQGIGRDPFFVDAAHAQKTDIGSHLRECVQGEIPNERFFLFVYFPARQHDFRLRGRIPKDCPPVVGYDGDIPVRQIVEQEECGRSRIDENHVMIIDQSSS